MGSTSTSSGKAVTARVPWSVGGHTSVALWTVTCRYGVGMRNGWGMHFRVDSRHLGIRISGGNGGLHRVPSHWRVRGMGVSHRPIVTRDTILPTVGLLWDRFILGGGGVSTVAGRCSMWWAVSGMDILGETAGQNRAIRGFSLRVHGGWPGEHVLISIGGEVLTFFALRGLWEIWKGASRIISRRHSIKILDTAYIRFRHVSIYIEVSLCSLRSQLEWLISRSITVAYHCEGH